MKETDNLSPEPMYYVVHLNIIKIIKNI